MRPGAWLLAAAGILLLSRAAHAQDSLASRAPSPAIVSGSVVVPGPKRDAPVAGLMVTVHRVGQDSAGPLDSARTDAQGHYTVRYTRYGSENALYFAAAVYRGIAYFTAPLRFARTEGDEAEITVF